MHGADRHQGKPVAFSVLDVQIKASRWKEERFGNKGEAAVTVVKEYSELHG